MRTLRALWIRLQGLFDKKDAGAEFAAELESHLRMHIEDNLRAGMNSKEARRQAAIKLGGVEQTKQAYRERGTLPWLEDMMQDLRYGLRMMARNPTFTSVAVITLAIGIGATTTIFSWIDAVLVRPLPGVANSDRLVTLESLTPDGEMVTNSYPDYRDFRDHLKLFDGIAVTRPAAFSIGQQDHAERIWGELVSGNFFAVLGVAPQIGRVFLPSEYGDKPGAFPIAVISDRYWRSHFHADPGIAGKTLRVNQHELTIVGVAPPAFQGSMPAIAFDLWVPYMQQPVLNGVDERMLLNRQNRNMLGIARLRRGVTLDQARNELATLAAVMSVANADVSQGMSATLLPLWKSPHGPQALLAAPLEILMGISMLVLLIVCANVANLLLAKAASREKEFSTRLALGAARSRLTRQVLTESLMLALTGAAAGVALTAALTAWVSRSLKHRPPPGQLTLALDFRWNGPVLLFILAMCIVTALLAGAAPILHLRHLDLNQRLNEGGRGGSGGTHSNRLRSLLVVSEVSLALIALIGAGLFAKGFRATSQIKPGFDPNHVLVSQFYLATSGYNLEQREAFCRRLQEKMESTPGVVNAAYSDGIPLGFEPSWWEDLRIEGYTPKPGENMKIFRNVISPQYLDVLRIPLVEGRNFTEHDNEDPTSQNVMIVNQEFVRRFFAGRIPIGRKIHGWGTWFTVVGVAADSKYHYLGESPLPYTYFPFRQVYRTDMQLAFYVRTQGDPESVLATLRKRVHEIDPNVTVFDAAPLKETIGTSLYPQKVAATLLAVMGTLAVLLAAVGMYSVMAYTVVQRTREIGIRIALGAKPADVLALIVRQGLALASVGLLVGVCLTLGLSRFLASVTFTGLSMGGGEKLLGSSATDPLIYLSSAALLCGIAALAAYIPARWAAKVEPMIALRSE
jgi:predicted permease